LPIPKGGVTGRSPFPIPRLSLTWYDSRAAEHVRGPDFIALCASGGRVMMSAIPDPPPLRSFPV